VDPEAWGGGTNQGGHHWREKFGPKKIGTGGTEQKKKKKGGGKPKPKLARGVAVDQQPLGKRKVRGTGGDTRRVGETAVSAAERG